MNNKMFVELTGTLSSLIGSWHSARRKRIASAVVGCVTLLIAGCDSSDDDVVYLTIQRDFQKTNCGERLSFYRVGGDGAIAGPKDANSNFSIPRGQSFILTDIHMIFSNPTTEALEQQFSIYIMGISGEVVLWSASAIAPPNKTGIYDRALTSGIRIAGPWPVCTAFSDQTHVPTIVLTGYLQ
jgi:hypothetical protein